jgi:hypothetical protein
LAPNAAVRPKKSSDFNEDLMEEHRQRHKVALHGADIGLPARQTQRPSNRGVMARFRRALAAPILLCRWNFLKSQKPLLTASDLSMKKKEVGLTTFCNDSRAKRVAARLL